MRKAGKMEMPAFRGESGWFSLTGCFPADSCFLANADRPCLRSSTRGTLGSFQQISVSFADLGMPSILSPTTPKQSVIELGLG